VTADEVQDSSALQIVTRVNGVEKQRGRLEELVFDVPTVLAYVSTFTALAPGDVIALGTPAGIGYREDPPRYLNPRDELSIELGGDFADPVILTNSVMADPEMETNS
jgi:2-keto-4-pentenoate hydratase/2-oxohepta-3-ene-1,7-dioic acid hydratase in catechol pathway